jgi:5-methylcytosine-specific restriction protein A
MGGAHPTILVVVNRDDFQTGHGTARIDGEDQPITAQTARRIAETGGHQEIETTPAGKILNLGDTHRCATPQQRRALAVRDKGCIIPGCTTPARWCEVHHIDPHRDGGPTDIGNMTLLCWWHHTTIDTGPYQLRMNDNAVPEIRWVFGSHATAWTTATHTPKRNLTPAT